MGLILAWVFGVFFTFMGIVGLFANPGGPLETLPVLAIGLLLLPAARNFLFAKTNIELSTMSRGLLILALFIVFGYFAAQRPTDKVGQPEQVDLPQQPTVGTVAPSTTEIVTNSQEGSPPMGAPPPSKIVSFLDPQALEIGQIYVLSEDTPLMPHHSPADPLAALHDMKKILKGGSVTILDVQKKGGVPWYKVSMLDQSTGATVTGWLNSTVLFGQQLKIQPM